MTLPHLPHLEQTLGDLVLDLLRARAEHPELVLSPPQDARGDASANAVRVTQHYTMALLAYGFLPEQEELAEAATWFATPFPNEYHRRIDAVEMNRLEALLALRPADPTVLPRLEQLTRQRTADDYFDIQAGGPAFDTLWAVKVLAQARDAGVLNGLMTDKNLALWSGHLVSVNHREKDLALALRIRCELKGGLTQAHLKYLDKLVGIAEQNGGLWGLSQDMRGIAEQMGRHQLVAEQIADHRDIFRETILSTCYVIENLMPLTALHPHIEETVRRAMEMWWQVFCGENAVNTLRALFPNPYDYLLIVCRTLVSARAYMGDSLIRWVSAYIHRRLAWQQPRSVEPPDHESIRHALKNWIRIDLNGVPEPLRLGMSDSNVVRIAPYLANPMQPDDDTFRLTIPNADTLIVKFGPVDEVNLERENYARLPASIRDCFVNIPQPSYVDDSRRRAFVIMADLNRYRTLSDALQRVPQIHEALVRELGPFLLRVHQGDGRGRRAQHEGGLLMQLYLLPMQQHVRRIFNYILENRLTEGDGKQRQAVQLQRDLLDQIGHLVRRQLELEDFPMACMHGDLHSRNIMVRRLKQREQPEREAEVDFKLIDLEKFRRGGDSALDAGELLVDLELMRATRNIVDDRDPLVALMRALNTTYTAFAEERADPTFGLRVRLAQARALIRVAKGRTKQGELALKESRKGPAIRVAYDALSDAESALGHLQAVAAGLG